MKIRQGYREAHRAALPPPNLLAEQQGGFGHTTKFTYSPDDELIETERPSGAVLKTEYDGAGAITAQIDGNEQATTYVRNVLEQPIEIIDPLKRKCLCCGQRAASGYL